MYSIITVSFRFFAVKFVQNNISLQWKLKMCTVKADKSLNPHSTCQCHFVSDCHITDWLLLYLLNLWLTEMFDAVCWCTVVTRRHSSALCYCTMFVVLLWMCQSVCSSYCRQLNAVSFSTALHAALYRSIYSLLTWSSLGTLQEFLGAFAKFRTATVSFVMSDGPSVRLHGTTLLRLHEILYLNICSVHEVRRLIVDRNRLLL